jgi:hypothetical protein
MQEPVARGTWCGFGRISQRGFTLTVTASLTGPKRTVALFGGHRGAQAQFDALLSARAEIEAEFGAPLEWRKHPKNVNIEMTRLDLASRPEDEQFEWFLDQMQSFVRVFRPRIDSLVVEISDPDNAMLADAAGGS